MKRRWSQTTSGGTGFSHRPPSSPTTTITIHITIIHTITTTNSDASPPTPTPTPTPQLHVVDEELAPSSSSSSSFYPKYGGLRHRIDFSPHHNDFISHQINNNNNNTTITTTSPLISPSQPEDLNNNHSFTLPFKLLRRFNLPFTFAILITALSSLLHRNFSLQNQVTELQDHIYKLSIRLQTCNLAESAGLIQEKTNHFPNKSLKIAALIISLTILSIPYLFLKYVDHVSKSKKSSDNITEVFLDKQLAYRVDAFLSVHPYAKPLALLVATLLLICLGGLSLFGVTDDGLADSLWLSWTYVADSGNHANSEAISEKLDSLRKGRSEVVEQNHTLILGWSDKLLCRTISV